MAKALGIRIRLSLKANRVTTQSPSCGGKFANCEQNFWKRDVRSRNFPVKMNGKSSTCKIYATLGATRVVKCEQLDKI